MMKRITFDGLFCDIAKCEDIPGGSYCENGTCSQRQVWERLKAIENILGDTYDLEHIRDLLQAEKDGRLEVLPCKVGDHILADGREAIIVWFFGYKTGRFLHVQFLDNAECADIPFYEIGKNRLSDPSGGGGGAERR